MKTLKSYRKFRTILSSVLLLSGLKMTCLQAQEAITATGGNASGSGGSVSYSVGQVVDTTSKGTNGSVAQGVQQPFEIAVVTGIKEAKAITLEYSAYPNPVSDILILRIEGSLQASYDVSLYDVNGKLLEQKKTAGVETSIDMKKLAPATYFLKIVQTQAIASPQEIKTFKIIKN